MTDQTIDPQVPMSGNPKEGFPLDGELELSRFNISLARQKAPDLFDQVYGGWYNAPKEVLTAISTAYNSMRENSPFDVISTNFKGQSLSFEEVVEHLCTYPNESYVIVDSNGLDRRPTDFVPSQDWEELKKRVL